MAEVIDRRSVIAEAAHRLAPAKRYWAVVGNGANRIAAAEVIKLSELCYKSIAADSTEDKKHIDLSSEPLIIVCAAGLEGSTADDVAKEVAIYRLTRRRRSSSPPTARPASPRRSTSCRCRRPTRAGVRALGHGGPPVRIRGGAGHRRPGACPCARPAAIEAATVAATARAPWSAGTGNGPAAVADRAATGDRRYSDGCGSAATTGSSRPRHGAPGPSCSATCSASSRSTPTRSTRARWARPPSSSTT